MFYGCSNANQYAVLSYVWGSSTFPKATTENRKCYNQRSERKNPAWRCWCPVRLMCKPPSLLRTNMPTIPCLSFQVCILPCSFSFFLCDSLFWMQSLCLSNQEWNRYIMCDKWLCRVEPRPASLWLQSLELSECSWMSLPCSVTRNEDLQGQYRYVAPGSIRNKDVLTERIQSVYLAI